jgi:DNA-binding NarL/FixJ family response regulator
MVKLKKGSNEKFHLHFYIIDRDTAFVNKLSRTLNNDPDYEIDSFHDINEFLSHFHPENTLLQTKENIHVIIIDSSQFEKKTDFEELKKIKQNNKNLEIILLTEKESGLFISDSDAIKAGVYATIPKNENIFYRIENSAKGIKSLKVFMKKRRTMKIALIAFIAFIALTGLLYFILQ